LIKGEDQSLAIAKSYMKASKLVSSKIRTKRQGESEVTENRIPMSRRTTRGGIFGGEKGKRLNRYDES